MINYISKSILNMPIRRKFIIFTIMVSIIPLAFIGIFSYKVSQEYLKESVIKTAIMKSEAVNSRLEKYLSDIDDTSLMLISSYTMQKYLTEYDLSKKYIYENDLRNLFSSTISSKNNIQSIILYDKDGNMRVLQTRIDDNGVLKEKVSGNITSTDIYEDVKRLSGKRIWTNLFKDTNLISMIRVVNESGSINPIGTIVINIDENNLKEGIEDIDLVDGEGLLISEHNDNIIYSSTNIKYIPETKGDRGYETIVYNGMQYLNIYYVSNFCGWRMNTFVPLNALFSKVEAIKEITVILIVICLALVIAFTILITYILTKPITKLSKLMGRVEHGDLEIRFDSRYNDEIGQLGRNFNSMIENTKNLLDENTKKQKRLRYQELKALQAQINPHFLYNTMDTINWLAQSIDADAISEISIALANYYRISLSKGAEIIKIKDEIKHVENYLTIQKIRFEKYLSYELNISEDILELYICKLTLQPIVENAIYHGIKDKQDNGVIRVDGRLEEGSVVFEIWDNGKGMSPEKLGCIRENLNKASVEGFGLNNTNERIKLFFGDQYGIEIESVENIFTRVKVTIPVIEALEE